MLVFLEYVQTQMKRLTLLKELDLQAIIHYPLESSSAIATAIFIVVNNMDFLV